MQTTIKINSLSSSGEGVGSNEGLKVFVEGALPTEKVSISLTERKKTYAKGKLLSIIDPSKDRIDPICPHFDRCGGCQLMHLNYDAQLLWKRQKVVDALTRVGHFKNPLVLPCLPSPQKLGYRNKIQLPILWEKNSKRIGLFQKKSHEIIPFENCLIQCREGGEILSLITDRLTHRSVRYVLIRNALFNKEAMVIFVTDGREFNELKKLAHQLIDLHPQIKGVVENINRREDNTILTNHFRLLAGHSYIYERLLGKRFKISAGSFFQINSAQTEHLYQHALTLAKIQPHERVLDAFCGVGTLALFAADYAKEVVGVECSASAIANARENARLNGVDNSHFYRGQAEVVISRLDPFDTVFLNPPRKGCSPKLLATLCQTKPKKIIYLSCQPATLARDLAILAPFYRINTIQPFDMFPQTMHLETVVELIDSSYANNAVKGVSEEGKIQVSRGSPTTC
ncbi:MAG: 23S rRNA (uracil(1939)-C(5))-methyltransferase RlmD [Chlamydiales bacterium]